jgi:putative transposase
MAIDKALIDQLLADYKKPEDIIGENGLLKQLTKAILERALQAELTDHLGFEKHDPAGHNLHRFIGRVLLGKVDEFYVEG